MENQSIPIHRAANRPILLLGCDRELIGFVMIAAFALIWIGQSWVALGYGLFLFCFFCLAFVLQRRPIRLCARFICAAGSINAPTWLDRHHLLI